MSTKVIYTSTVSFPVYASWKCHNCGTCNYSEGVISSQGQAEESSFKTRKQEEAKQEASDIANDVLKRNALNIIFNTKNSALRMRHCLFLQNTKCKKCGKKPKWDKDGKYIRNGLISFVVALISGLLAFSDLQKSIIVWIVFALSLGFFINTFFIEKQFERKIANMPEEYLPVIGSHNNKLIEYAKLEGKTILSEEEVIQVVKENDMNEKRVE